MKSELTVYVLCVLAMVIQPCDAQRVRPGIDVFISKTYKDYKGSRLGLITNQTGVTSDLESSADAIFRLKDPKLIKLFGPEHGIRGDVEGGNKIGNEKDKQTGLPVYSLYGSTRKPTVEMLAEVDVLLYDIQDVGNRTYTYISTMAYAMQACARNSIRFVVLDRPIPLYGRIVDGNVLDPAFSSFIGLYPIPYVYGMTPGELAVLFNEEFDIGADLEVVRMEGYNHNMEFEDTGLYWIPSSPHIPHAETAYYCATTGCMGELHTVCIGVGYTLPFELVGTAWIDGDDLADALNARNLPGVIFRPVHFRPYYHVFAGQHCSGVQILVTDTKRFLPFTTQVHILEAIQLLYPDNRFLDARNQTHRIASFNKAAGTDQLRRQLLAGMSAEQIIDGYRSDLSTFKKIRSKYLLYE